MYFNTFSPMDTPYTGWSFGFAVIIVEFQLLRHYTLALVENTSVLSVCLCAVIASTLEAYFEL